MSIEHHFYDLMMEPLRMSFKPVLLEYHVWWASRHLEIDIIIAIKFFKLVLWSEDIHKTFTKMKPSMKVQANQKL